MNKIIKELHNRACRLDMEQYPDSIPDGERIQQRFAELIVQKCLGIVEKNHEKAMNEYDTDVDYAMCSTIVEIEQQFGVEL